MVLLPHKHLLDDIIEVIRDRGYNVTKIDLSLDEAAKGTEPKYILKLQFTPEDSTGKKGKKVLPLSGSSEEILYQLENRPLNIPSTDRKRDIRKGRVE